MSYLETGHLGSKVVSWRRANPRELLKSIIDAKPEATKNELIAEMRHRILGDDAYLDAVVEFYVVNTRRCLMKPPAATTKRELRTRVDEIKRSIEANLLDHVMPNGVLLRDCTQADLRRVGGWFEALANRLKRGQKVGDVFDAAGIRAFYDSKGVVRVISHRSSKSL